MREEVAYCHMIASVCAADGMMDGAEREFLDQAMDELGLTEEERDQVRNFEGTEEAERIVKGMSLPRRESLRDALLGATLADGKISPHESALVKRISALLGF